jgi:hypothetical protein
MNSAEELPVLRLTSYYFAFGRSGERVVDEVLSAVAIAGKCHHHTFGWDDSDNGEPSCIDNIQAAANRAAAHVVQLTTQLAHLTALVEQGARLETPCVWSYDGGEYAYKGDCGVSFQFTEGGTAENGFRFCHACGRPVEDSSLWPDPIDEDADEAIDAAQTFDEAVTRALDIYDSISPQPDRTHE